MQQFPNGSSVTFTLGSATKNVETSRIILGYERKADAGRLRVLVNGQPVMIVQCGLVDMGRPAGFALAVAEAVMPASYTNATIKIERLGTDGTSDPRVLAYHFDLGGADNQLMHCDCGVAGSLATKWDEMGNRIYQWWRLVSGLEPGGLTSNPFAVDQLYVNLGGNDIQQQVAAAGTVADLQNVMRRFFQRSRDQHALCWGKIEFPVTPGGHDPMLPLYSYPPLIVYNLIHDKARVKVSAGDIPPPGPPDFYYRALLFQAASTDSASDPHRSVQPGRTPARRRRAASHDLNLSAGRALRQPEGVSQPFCATATPHATLSSSSAWWASGLMETSTPRADA